VCINVFCAEGGSREIKATLEERLGAVGSPVGVKGFVCFGACTMGPNLVLYPAGTWYAGVDPGDLDDILGHIQGGRPVARLAERIDPLLHEIILDILDSGLE
jgi:NADH-quinone oxidoreductase subunit F/NADP-reducing hydrogenase subunit HndC